MLRWSAVLCGVKITFRCPCRWAGADSHHSVRVVRFQAGHCNSLQLVWNPNISGFVFQNFLQVMAVSTILQCRLGLQFSNGMRMKNLLTIEFSAIGLESKCIWIFFDRPFCRWWYNTTMLPYSVLNRSLTEESAHNWVSVIETTYHGFDAYYPPSRCSTNSQQ